MNIFHEAQARLLINLRAIGRPEYDNRRLGNQVDWIVDNFTTAKRYYHALGEVMNNQWDKEAVDFLKCQYDQQVLARENERLEAV